MSDGAEPGGAGEPGAARIAYRRLRSASGVGDLDDLEHRLDRLEEGVGEELGLLRPLAERVAGLEADLLPLLERRAARRAARDLGHRPGT